MIDIVRLLTGLPKPEGTTWARWAQERIALVSWPTLAVLYLVGVTLRIHIRALMSGLAGEDRGNLDE